MSQVLTLASSAGPLPPALFSADDEDFFTADHGLDSGHGSSENFADKLIDMDFPMFDVSTCSSLPSLTCPSIQLAHHRKRHIWTNALLNEELLLTKAVKKSGPVVDEDNPFIDVLSDSCSTTSSKSDISSSSLDSAGIRSPLHRTLDHSTPYHSRSAEHSTFSSTRLLRNSIEKPSPFITSTRTRLFSHSSRDRISRMDSVSRGDTLEPDRCQKEKVKSTVNPREEMNMLRLSCTCQNRNTGKNLHLWEFLLEMLADRRMKSVITWTGQDREFRVVNSREVAREWGNRKNKPHMNFDKMSRAMRYYYKKNILTHGNKQRLVYSFGKDNPICPHYEKIIKLALRTRPTGMGSSKTQTISSFEEEPQVTTTSQVPALPNPAKSTGAFFMNKKESERMLTERLCHGGGRRWASFKRASPQCVRSCCEAYKPFQSRSSATSSKLKTGVSNQNKIKISKDAKQFSDRFTFP